MKKYILPSIKLTAVFTVILCILYPLFISFAAKLSKGEGSGEKVMLNGKAVGYKLIGQSFTAPQYFWGRPSAVGYNAAGSAGSNKGPTNTDYLKEVSNRIDTLLKYHPTLQKSEIPAEMVTASGSGLDPNISVKGAEIQAKRIATYRHLPLSKVLKLIETHTEKPLLGLFGPKKVNVLALNVALDQISK
ncbi:K(+)-transporting ATPase subunit C [Pedobacter xixiisoli]|uniref:Potassium-transporting ATPase KdpC subunit n=1 Tax=Pedobacter xixiisoli TaxID=1476464 RepID=A0A285ZSI3_9SPHI|nr:K(+)-transporting ATPase subunit C [Pedobacter xixiisoli]SOD12602.1 K+-transporting ATPase ATPase C chain [Pedobacter xixiisoli]